MTFWESMILNLMNMLVLVKTRRPQLAWATACTLHRYSFKTSTKSVLLGISLGSCKMCSFPPNFSFYFSPKRLVEMGWSSYSNLTCEKILWDWLSCPAKYISTLVQYSLLTKKNHDLGSTIEHFHFFYYYYFDMLMKVELTFA